MKNLILIRHAKSSWDAPLQDFDRPLMQRGIKDAHDVATSCLSFLPKQFQVLSSGAKKERRKPQLFLLKIFHILSRILYFLKRYIHLMNGN